MQGNPPDCAYVLTSVSFYCVTFLSIQAIKNKCSISCVSRVDFLSFAVNYNGQTYLAYKYLLPSGSIANSLFFNEAIFLLSSLCFRGTLSSLNILILIITSVAESYQFVFSLTVRFVINKYKSRHHLHTGHNLIQRVTTNPSSKFSLLFVPFPLSRRDDDRFLAFKNQWHTPLRYTYVTIRVLITSVSMCTVVTWHSIQQTNILFLNQINLKILQTNEKRKG